MTKLALALIAVTSLTAQTPTLSLEDELAALMNTSVTVAGKVAQKISDVPAIVSVITAEDLKREGYTNIYEALSRLPGVNVTETFYGYTSVSFRGNLQAHYNNKWLLVLNDHPDFDPVTGDSRFESIPFSQIKRIEVIRGPGSAMYGTNAFVGVVKVITFDGSEGDAIDTSTTYGSNNLRGSNVRYAVKSGDFHLSVGAGAEKSDGYSLKVLQDENGRSGELPYRNDASSVSASMGYGSWKLNAGVFQNVKSKFGLVPTLVSTGDRTLYGKYIDSSYNVLITEKTDLNIFAYYDDKSKGELIAWYPPAYVQQSTNVGGPEYQTYTGTKYGIGIQSATQFTSSWRTTVGLFADYQKTSPYEWKKLDGSFSAFNTSAWHENYSSNNKGGFIQLDGRLGQYFGVVGGLRYTNNDVTSSFVSPSAGIVYNATSKLTFKALYGSGSRDANFFEKYVATMNVIDGNATLLPEKMKSYELGMDYMFGSQSLRLNAFYEDTSDLISRSLVAPIGYLGNTRPTPQYGNTLGQKMTGIEAELRGSLHYGEFHFVNVSLLKGTEKVDSSDALFIPKVLANVGVNLSPIKEFTISPYIQYVGKKEGSLMNGTPVSTKAYTLVNMNFELRFSALRLALTGKNLFNKVYSNPEYIRRLIAETPGGPGRSVYFSIGYSR